PRHLAVTSDGGRRQHSPSGQWETIRWVVSWPRKYLASSVLHPIVTASGVAVSASRYVLHQNSPAGVSVYWAYSANLSCEPNAWRVPHFRHARWPSIIPALSVGKGTPSFSYAFQMTPSSSVLRKCTARPRWWVARLVRRWAAIS